MLKCEIELLSLPSTGFQYNPMMMGGMGDNNMMGMGEEGFMGNNGMNMMGNYHYTVIVSTSLS